MAFMKHWWRCLGLPWKDDGKYTGSPNIFGTGTEYVRVGGVSLSGTVLAEGTEANGRRGGFGTAAAEAAAFGCAAAEPEACAVGGGPSLPSKLWT